MTRKERILEKLRELGAEPKRSLGQNFLISDHVVDRILFAVKSEPFPEMVEVGPGLGAITDDLLTLGQPLTLLELDRRFVQAWRERAEKLNQEKPGSLRVVEGDALQMNWPELGLPPGTLFVSNLPYQISSSLVIERSVEPAQITRMILMFQKEVAQRIAAKASTPDYGLLTVIAQTFWETSTVVDAGPGCFFPPPNVASRVLMFKRRPNNWDQGEGVSRQGFLRFAKAAFSHRRKLLSRNLESSYFQGAPGSFEKIEHVLSGQGLTKTARAEELDPAAFVRLYLAIVSVEKGQA